MIKEDPCMKLYNEMKMLYLEIDASEVEHWAILLQRREGMGWFRGKVSDNNILKESFLWLRACKHWK